MFVFHYSQNARLPLCAVPSHHFFLIFVQSHLNLATTTITSMITRSQFNNFKIFAVKANRKFKILRVNLENILKKQNKVEDILDALEQTRFHPKTRQFKKRETKKDKLYRISSYCYCEENKYQRQYFTIIRKIKRLQRKMKFYRLTDKETRFWVMDQWMTRNYDDEVDKWVNITFYYNFLHKHKTEKCAK